MRRSAFYRSSIAMTLVAFPLFHPLMAAPRALYPERPTLRDLYNIRVFEEVLVPLGQPTEAETQALAKAINAYVSEGSMEDFQPLRTFLKEHPRSPWRLSLLVNLGLAYRYRGYQSRAMETFEEAWSHAKSDTTREGINLANTALGELLEVATGLGRKDRLDVLMKEAASRSFSGSITEKVAMAKAAYQLMSADPSSAFRCGPLALARFRAFQEAAPISASGLVYRRTSPRGSSLAMLQEWASGAGMKTQLARRQPGAPMVTPAVVHLRSDHFSTLLEEANGRYRIQDPNLGEYWISRKALEEEASGYALVPQGALPKGWTTLAPQESGQVWGRSGWHYGYRPPRPCSESVGPCEAACTGGDGAGSGPGGGGPGGGPGGSGPGGGSGGPGYGIPAAGGYGMPVYKLFSCGVGLSITDTPLWYANPYGPQMALQLSYSQRDTTHPAVIDYCNFGPKWSFNYLSCIKDDTANPAAIVSVCYPGGGGLYFKPLEGGGYTPDQETYATLTKLSDTSYVVQYRSGKKDFYTIPDRPSGQRRVVLTRTVSPQGHETNLTWDMQLRLNAVVDPLGRSMTFAYELTGDPLKITRVTAPDGRFATFQYTDGYLTQITDMGGLSSSFAYGPTTESPDAPADFINAMTTPYGTHRFFMSECPIRAIEVENPLGQRERLETTLTYANIPGDPLPAIPEIPSTTVATFPYRNSIYWDRRAYADRVRDFSKARILQWGTDSGILIGEKRPLEGRVFFVSASDGNGRVFLENRKGRVLTPEAEAVRKEKLKAHISPDAPAPLATRRFVGGQTLLTPQYDGAVNLVTRRARVLDDGSTQVSKYDYDLNGKLVRAEDPLGRVTSYVYSADGQDMLEVRQTTGTSNDLLAQYTYNAAHQPLTIKDAAGQVTTLTYNPQGQVLTITNPKNETTTFTYNTAGYLQSTTGPVAGSTTTFTYDVSGRVHTVTGPDGKTVTTEYDNLDRPVLVTYPDGTTEQMVYDRMELSRRKDRKGRWTILTHNALRQLTEVQDPLGRVTRFEWCGCGGSSLEALTDPLGRITNWWRDLQGRVIGKRLEDGTETRYAYDYSGRLVQRTDAKGHRTLYEYYPDDSLKQVSYPDSGGTTPPVSYTYGTTYKRLATMTDQFGVTTYAYNPVTTPPTPGAGRLASIDGPWANDTITYTYDELGRILSRAINGVAESRTYDTLGRLGTTTNPLGLFTYTYAGTSSRLQEIAYPNGQRSVFTYTSGANEEPRLQSLQHVRSDNSPISTFGYTYDADGQILTWSQAADAALPKVYSFGYDDANQLTSAILNGPGGTLLKQYAYGYDLAGNRTSETIDGNTTTSEHNSTNQLTSQRTAPNTAPRRQPSAPKGRPGSSPAPKAAVRK